MPVRGAQEKHISNVSTACRVLVWEVGPTLISEQGQETLMDLKEDGTASVATQELLEQSYETPYFFQKWEAIPISRGFSILMN